MAILRSREMLKMRLPVQSIVECAVESKRFATISIVYFSLSTILTAQHKIPVSVDEVDGQRNSMVCVFPGANAMQWEAVEQR